MSSFVSHDSAASLLQVSPDELTRLVGSGVVRRAAPGKYSPAQVIRDYIGYLQREPDRRERAPTQVELAAHLDMSERNLRDVLDQIGLNHKQASMADVRVAYIRHLREQAAGRYTEGPLDLAQERAALAREQRAGLEIKNAVLRGEYAAVSLLADVLATASQAVSERFDHLPGVLKKSCPQLDDAARDHVVAVIAAARNEWVRSTAELVRARMLEPDDEPELDLEATHDEPRAD